MAALSADAGQPHTAAPTKGIPMIRPIQRTTSTLVLAVLTGLLLPTLVALADDGPAGSDLRGAAWIWVTCGVLVIIASIGLFMAWRGGQFEGDVEDVKYRMLDAEDPADLPLTQWQPKPKRQRMRRAGPRSA